MKSVKYLISLFVRCIQVPSFTVILKHNAKTASLEGLDVSGRSLEIDRISDGPIIGGDGFRHVGSQICVVPMTFLGYQIRAA
jgi:hypothetical protein